MVKVGSSVLTQAGEQGVNSRVVGRLVAQAAELVRGGRQVIIVTSGAISAGLKRLGILGKHKGMPFKQAAAAVGQTLLMQAYERSFARYGLNVGQVLLTHEDVQERRRFLNARNTLLTLLAQGAVPIINENDTVAVEEIQFGDNDTLAAQVANMAEADLLVLLSDVEGMFTADPALESGAERLSVIRGIGRAVRSAAGMSRSPLAVGGMVTKLEAIRIVGALGIPAVIARGRSSRVLPRLLAGEDVGTLFLPEGPRLTHRKGWIAFALKPRGWLQVDRGARRALVEQGRSLLPSGVADLGGSFEFGDPVSCRDEEGREFARGLVNYGARELAQIRGHHTRDIEHILGYKYYDEVIHRDNLTLLREESGGAP